MIGMSLRKLSVPLLQINSDGGGKGGGDGGERHDGSVLLQDVRSAMARYESAGNVRLLGGAGAESIRLARRILGAALKGWGLGVDLVGALRSSAARYELERAGAAGADHSLKQRVRRQLHSMHDW